MVLKHIVYYIYTILELYDEIFTILLVINTVKPKKKKKRFLKTVPSHLFHLVGLKIEHDLFIRLNISFLANHSYSDKMFIAQLLHY